MARPVVLWLGGNTERGHQAVKEAARRPDSVVLVSSEGDPARCLEILAAGGIARSRVILDYAAWDTVTNFTQTWPLLQRLNPSEVVVVTDGFHMRRSLGIALIALGLRGFAITAAPSSAPGNREPWRLTLEDWLRTLIWRLTGYQHRWEQLYRERWPYLKEQERLAAELP